MCRTLGWTMVRMRLQVGFLRSWRRGGEQRHGTVAEVVKQNAAVELERVRVAGSVLVVVGLAMPGEIEILLLLGTPKGGLEVAEDGSGDRRGVESALAVLVGSEGVGGVGERRRRL